MVRSIDSRLGRIEAFLSERRPVDLPLMSRAERREFALSLGREILAQASGSTVDGEWMRRLKDLSELDRQAVRNVTFGLWAYGFFGPECQRRILEDWWADSTE